MSNPLSELPSEPRVYVVRNRGVQYTTTFSSLSHDAAQIRAQTAKGYIDHMRSPSLTYDGKVDGLYQYTLTYWGLD